MKSVLTPLLILITILSHGQFVPNYEESKVPGFTLPPLLVNLDGSRVTTIQEWEQKRRKEILEVFLSQVYGRLPEKNIQVSFELLDKNPALDGRAVRKQVGIKFSDGIKTHTVHLLIYLPAGKKEKAPVFLGYNFYGNHTIYPDPGIYISESWVSNYPEVNIFDHKADERSRGFRSGRWPVNRILDKGYGLAVMYYGDLDPDFDDGFRNGLHSLYYQDTEKPAADEWGSISTWAWGLMKAMDYFETDPDIDAARVAVIGHSRLGKTSLWAGALDERFALVISNESGCGGAALSKRKFGETVGRINTSFPHWFCDNFNQYNEREENLPADQHQLIALMAPRPVYIASAVEDQWADPRGEFLSGYYASEIYNLYGLNGLENERMPDINSPRQSGYIAYHIRSGEHDLTYYDWEQFLNFADFHLKK